MKKQKIIFILILIIAVSTIILGISNKKTFEEIDINGETQNKLLAIMIRDEKDKEYKKQNSLDFPNKENYRYIGSTCTDNKDNKLNGKEYIRYDEETKKAYLTTNKTIHCSLFFANALPAAEQILKYSSKYLESEQDVTDRGDVLRRFQGTAEMNEDGTIDETSDVNNYICFGTTDKDECVSNTDKYMYRIIGYAINNDLETLTYIGQLKIIKKEALNKYLTYWKNNDEDSDVPNSLAYQAIVGDDFLENKNYVSDSWKEIIENHKWPYGYERLSSLDSCLNLFSKETGKMENSYFVKNLENGAYEGTVYSNSASPYAGQKIKYDIKNELWSNKLLSKVGLMYGHDYCLTISNNINCNNSKNEEICKSSWIHLSNNDSDKISTDHQNPPRLSEMLINPVGFDCYWGNYHVRAIKDFGTDSGGYYSEPFSVRPVIYINQDIFLMGTGTQSDPYRIISSDLN